MKMPANKQLITPWIVALVLITIVATPTMQQLRGADDAYENISCYEAKRRLETDPTIFLLDVRSSVEFYKGHIMGAVNINVYYLVSNHSLLPVFPEESSRGIIVYCDNGFRSQTAAEKLLSYGYTNVSNIEKGFNEWLKLGYPFVVGSETIPITTNIAWRPLTVTGLFTIILGFSLLIIVQKVRKR
ncbi:MAG: hypothetical protein DRP02_02885 [Candidatus Gerdarchaeota archaeon]|nr:MAG: hypothetical protein DRP02_02885 [Candidatus Gerdarchaeota archaeon]